MNTIIIITNPFQDFKIAASRTVLQLFLEDTITGKLIEDKDSGTAEHMWYELNPIYRSFLPQNSS
jgi:hypothetical protein